MHRRHFLARLTAASAGTLLPVSQLLAAPLRARNVVLLHGLFADGSCWSDVIGHLLTAGLRPTPYRTR